MSDDLKFPSPEEMREWLEREITNSKRAAELRIKDATAFVNDYSTGKLTAHEAAERSYQYSQQWGDAVPIISKTYEEIRNRQAEIGRGSLNLR